MAAAAAGQARTVDAATQAQSHAGHESVQQVQQTPPPPSPPPPPPQEEHSGHTPADRASAPPGGPPPAGLPPITDEDRAAAFPVLDGRHSVHDHAVHAFVLFDRLEWQTGDGVNGLGWDTSGWIGGDVNRFRFRTEGEREDGDVRGAVHALFGRAIAPWWDLVAGVRQDMGPGPARTWAAAGVQGLAPYWFEVEATAHLGESGRTYVRLETEYELLLTSRLVLQPRAELQIHGKADPERGIGAGLSSLDAGLRLRYEIRRELAPYVGVTWNRKFFGTADRAEATGAGGRATRLVLGLRFWM